MIPPVASQFIAGKTAQSAVEKSKDTEENITPIFNFLGEHYTKKKHVEETMEEYSNLVDEISHADQDIEISVKPTQIGLDIKEELFVANAEEILQMCSENEIFVWFDMEDESTIDATVETYKYLLKEYPGQVGLCLQANIKRTRRDLNELSKRDECAVRLVKGAYSPPNHIAYTKKEEIDERYELLIEKALKEIDGRVAVGTHDNRMIDTALDVEDPVADLEFQMLKGVREDKQKELSENYPVGQYMPYGGRWLSYTYRRIKERPRNILLIGRAIKNSIF